MAYQEQQSVVAMITRALDGAAGLVQAEVRLVRAELNEKVSRLANGGAMIGASAVLMIAGLVLLLLSVVRWLAIAGLPEEWGLLLIGLLAAAGGGLLLSRGVQSFKSTNLVPDRSFEQIRADVAAVKEHVT